MSEFITGSLLEIIGHYTNPYLSFKSAQDNDFLLVKPQELINSFSKEKAEQPSVESAEIKFKVDTAKVTVAVVTDSNAPAPPVDIYSLSDNCFEVWNNDLSFIPELMDLFLPDLLTYNFEVLILSFR